MTGHYYKLVYVCGKYTTSCIVGKLETMEPTTYEKGYQLKKRWKRSFMLLTKRGIIKITRKRTSFGEWRLRNLMLVVRVVISWLLINSKWPSIIPYTRLFFKIKIYVCVCYSLYISWILDIMMLKNVHNLSGFLFY